ncbi:unnamed protein product [Didymodactylos carnosus]|uniref:Uncharacterized protein n=1 Tax=Didymodactylos carnosus TaxID=1234261 RepID=A0A813XLU8_9BILA|nr:unnamed protein product [Didymodactylos carnosus]CAF0878105.1 unnamed protein product [Didymodactylos carnosus]CAF3639317.1 unnamed protein product [Didymodactylos carnosus]CAF3664719.1 unnamed protein product [Didymodactylos carnosus]
MFDNEDSTLQDDTGLQYVDCIRLIDGGQLHKFESLVMKHDLIKMETTTNNKPLLFNAIEHNDENFVRLLLEMEVPLDKTYGVMIQSSDLSMESSIPSLENQHHMIKRLMNAHEYALELNRPHLANIIWKKMNLPSFEERYQNTIRTNDIRKCDNFIRKIRNEKRQYELCKEGIFLAAYAGSVRLLDYFLTRWKIDINIQKQTDDGYITTPILTAITSNQSEASKFLLFRGADGSLKGQFDNALVTALNYNSHTDLIRLLLEKNVDLTARHPSYPKLSLRDYCVITDRVKAKCEIDNYIAKLISNGSYKKLKYLVDHGYTHLNVRLKGKRDGRQLANERYYSNIVKLIDDVEEAKARARQKMNY